MMGEGVTGAERTQAAGPLRDKTLLTGVASLCALAAAIIVIILLKDTREPDHLQAPWAWPVLLSLFTVFWLGAQLLRHSAMWGAYAAAYERPARARDPEEERIIRLGYSEFFIYLAASLCGLGAIAYLSSGTGHFGAVEFAITGTQVKPLHLALFLGYFVAAFVPLGVVIFRHVMLEARVRRREGRGVSILRDDVVSDTSFWTTAILVAGLVALAWAAAGEMFTMEEDFGVFITFLVLLVFLVIILAPHVMRLWNDRRELRDGQLVTLSNLRIAGVSVARPGQLVSLLDSVLVRFVAPLSGATQNGPLVPHVLVLIVILPLSALGYVLAAPWGLIPIGMAMLIALALGRRWAWVEEDRDTASRLRTTKSSDIHIGFDNDLKDEALLGYASLFVLVPLALHQLQGWTHAFVVVEEWSSNNAFIDWLRFFGAELAKAVPFVDWWEIYNVDIETPFDASASTDPLAKHLTFAARAMVDLVIMAALFQAIGLWQRSRMDRRLYESGQYDAFDPFTEKAFFERGMWWNPKSSRREPKKTFVQLVAAHVKERTAHRLEPYPYNQRRLSELIHSDNEDVRAGAEWMIQTYKVLAGSAIEQLGQLSLRLAENTDNHLRSNADRSFARVHKIELERILQELLDHPTLFGESDVPVLVGALEAIRSVPEFTYAQIQAVQLLKAHPSQRATHALFKLVMQKKHFETEAGREMWDMFQRELGSSSIIFLDQFASRLDVFEALRSHAYAYTGSQRNLCSEIASFLDWMGQHDAVKYAERGDKSQTVRKVVREYESEVRTLCRF